VRDEETVEELAALVTLHERNDRSVTVGPPPLDAYRDTERYRRWVEERRRRGLDGGPEHSGTTHIGVVVYGAGTDAAGLDRTLRSVADQSLSPPWVHVLGAGETGRSDDSGGDVEGHTPPWMVLVRSGGELAPHALAHVAGAIETGDDVDVVYSDEDHLDDDGGRSRPVFKPDWSPELLDCCPYLGHLLAVRSALLEPVGALGESAAPAPDLDAYDVMLRAAEGARRIVHVPHVLYHRSGPDTGWFIGEPSTPRAGATALEHALERRGERARVEDGPLPGTFHVRRELSAAPVVSVIVPFRDQPGLLRACVDSLRAASGHERVELVLVDNESAEPETAALLDRLAQRPGVRVLSHPGAFNWSAINNRAVTDATGDVLLFVNNDIEARRPGWMAVMLEHAVRAEVGAVGARLVYPDGSTQHVGTVLGLGVVAAHVMAGVPRGDPGYLALGWLTRDVSSVTGACLMCRREVFERVGGFDERLRVACSDTDFCLKLADAGLRVVLAAQAELVHHESKTRGMTGYYDDYIVFLERWHERLRAGDPYFSPNLSRLDYGCVVRPLDEDATWETKLAEWMRSSSN
jgi:GT2 family glycosyltransferase